MKIASRWFLLLAPVVLVIGCTGGTSEQHHGAGTPGPATTPAADPAEEADVQAAMAKLDPADRKLAEAQRFCAVVNDDRLGAMGPPFKLMVNGQPVFLCCDGCAKKALADPEKTLARVKELKAKTAQSVAK